MTCNGRCCARSAVLRAETAELVSKADQQGGARSGVDQAEAPAVDP
jgi:hypothetical protein